MIAYASRTGTRRNLAALREVGWRLMVSAAGVLRTEGFLYGLDNGAWSAFTQGRAFDDKAFRKALRLLGSGADWTVLPDVVCGGPASLDLSLRSMRMVLDETPRALIAVQDGMTPNDVRGFIGDRVGIFVGGSTAWKVDCWVHVGRVNSVRRIAICTSEGVTSFDGSSASRFAVTVPPMDAAKRQLGLFTHRASRDLHRDAVKGDGRADERDVAARPEGDR